MSEFLDRINKLPPKHLALLALELNDQLERRREPIAVVGMAGRFPGAGNIDRYWDLLRTGRDAIREVPADRWDIDALYDPDPDVPARMSVRCGGFLDDIQGFDAAFFGISPREALTMDPQQRLLLEVAWEALEHAGIAPDRLAGTPTGVFLGLCNSDHFWRLLGRGPEAIDAYLASGNAPSVAAGRISYVLGLHGPALTIDTACSASLVALHVACQSLRADESRLALVGGVNLMCAPETTIALSKSHMLAPDGRCKTFDAAADGFSRGEGCAVLALKRLSTARADGDRVLALIRGSAVNQDGRSGGLTVPNGLAQEAVIRAALADAGVDPTEIDYAEAHGTGTSLGDPIEVRALARALRPGAPGGRPLVIGSVKTNIGHLEAAAGIAGVVKVILALMHEHIPPHLHFKQPNPHIPWSELPVEVASEGRSWRRGARRRLAGVSSFGFGGTNAHAIVEEAPAGDTVAATKTDRPLHCLPLAARTAEALTALAARIAEALPSAAEPNGFPVRIADVAHTAGVGRSHGVERLAVIAADTDEARAALAAFVGGGTHPSLHRGTAAPGAREVVFMFTGQGAQYPGMSARLYDTAPVFRAALDECDAVLGGRLKPLLYGDGPAIHETASTQPALFAVEYALAQLWRSWGVEPAAVIGHSVGEYVAACVAGVFGLEDGLRLIAERGRLMAALPPGGSMAALFAPVDEVAAVVAPMADRVAIAAINAPDSIVVSGAAEAVDAVLAEFQKRDVKGHKLFISLAAHSPLVEPALAAMEACARTVAMKPPRIPVAWNLTGGTPLPGGAPDATYWRRHLREPVRFADGIAALYRDGYRTFLEVGPHPTLCALARRSLPEDAALFGSLRRNKDDWRELLSSVAALYVSGVPIDWAGSDRPYARRRVSLPTYPFEHRRFWTDVGTRAARRGPRRHGPNPLLGERLATATPIFEVGLSPGSAKYLADHCVFGATLVAGPVLLEMAQAAANGARPRAVEQFSIHEPLILPDEGRTVQIHLTDDTKFAIHSRAGDGTGDWTLHATGKLVAPRGLEEGPPLTAVVTALGAPIPSEPFYERLAGAGIRLGPAVRVIGAVRRSDGEVLAELALPGSCAGDVVSWAHPAVLDGAFQCVGLAVPEGGPGDDVYLLSEVEWVELNGPLPPRLWCHARLRDAATGRPTERCGDVTLRAPDGVVVGVVRGVRLRRTGRAELVRATGSAPAEGPFYDVAWEPAPVAPHAAGSLVEPGRFVPALRSRFAALAAANDMAVYGRLLPELDRLSAEHVAVALRALGFDDTLGRTFTADTEGNHLGVGARHRRLFARLLALLAEDGILAQRGAAFEVSVPLPSPSPEARYDALLKQFGAVDGELRTLRRCGGELARVLRGDQDPLQLLFPGGSLAEARQLYVESPFARTFNTLLAEALQAALAKLPAAARVRILEIGAGSGGTTTYVLPRLPADRVEYTFTDLSPLFLDRAAEQFAGYPFLRRARLDIERDPVAQGFAAGGYDIVIAANVLHATADLRQSLDHTAKLLAPGGLLFLLEGVAPERWVDLTFGLTEGWWRFTDTDLRPAYPLLPRAAWLELLGAVGFIGAAALPETGQQALVVARAPTATQQWLVVGEGDEAAALVDHLKHRGDRVTLVAAAQPIEKISGADRIVYLGDAEPAFIWLGRLARGELSGRVWLITDGSVRRAPLWGLGRTFALEHPDLWGGLVEAEPGTATAALVAALEADDGEDQVAWRDGHRVAARLVPAAPPAGAAPEFRGDATYLVTGGFGGLGQLVARWLVARGARHVALLGRRADPAADGVKALEALGVRVTALAGDVADEPTLTRLLARLAAEAPPVRGVVHAAAHLDAAPIAVLTPAAVTAMLRPKVAGTVLLHRLLPELDFLVLFSSTTALLGASGLAHYAAANAFLDAFARIHNRPGHRVLSVNWGTWESMRMASADRQRSYREAGLDPMSAAEALDALGRLLAGAAPQAVVARINWGVLKPLHEARRQRPFLSRLSAVAATGGAKPPAEPVIDLATRLSAAPADARHDIIAELVSREVAAVLGLDGGAAVPPDMGLFELGMDSLMSVELKRRLEENCGRRLPSTLTFNYPTVTALAGFLDREFSPAAPAPAPRAGANELDALSDEELERRLRTRLEQSQ